MANYLEEIEVMTSDGNIIKTSKEENQQLFRCLQCGLGAIGIIGDYYTVIYDIFHNISCSILKDQMRRCIHVEIH
jgi:hypothetical protein